MSQVRIAVQLQPQHADYTSIRDAVTRAEAMGIDIAYNWDHFYPLYGEPDGRHFECWTMLGAWAEQTTRIRIGSLVTCNSYRNPQLLADMARTVDHISGGRLIFGIGSGWFQRDYDEYGYEFGTVVSRLRDLGRDLPLIKARWAKLNPPPAGEMPILIGGGGEKMTLRLVAEHADVWHGFGTPEVIAHKLDVLRRHCDDVGRNFDSIDKSVDIQLARVSDTAALRAAYYDLGVREFTFGINGPGYELGFLEDWLDWRDRINA